MVLTEKKEINLFIKYLFASFGSAIVVSIYSLVDALCVGQFEGEVGSAALAVVMPLWTIIFSCGLLFGIGGATLMTDRRGKKDNDSNVFYTISFILALITTIILWILINIFEDQLLIFFGAKSIEVFNYAKKYTFWLKLSLPIFLLGQYLTCFIRNDNAPLKATISVITGGIVNIILDITFVFICKMGIFGAGLATMIGQIVGFIILCSHFFSKKRQFKLVKINNFKKYSFEIIKIGIPSFILDIAMGVLTILFNNQIVKYNSLEKQTAILAIYGVICNIVSLVQSLCYAIGQASQPLISANFGSNNINRVKKFLKYGIITAFIVSFIVVILLESFPSQILKLFISVDNNSLTLKLCNSIERKYFISFLFMGFNIYSTYYFQSILKAHYAFSVSILRGIVISMPLLFILPLSSFDNIWWTMLITEGIVFIINSILVIKTYKLNLNMELNYEK